MGCKSTWSSEHEKLEPGDKINVVMVKIAYCPVCAEDFAKEVTTGSYDRRTNAKRIK